MASAETAKLIATLDLQGNFIKNVGNAQKSLGALSSSIAKSRAVAVGLGVGLEHAVTAGIRGLSGAIESGIASAQELEKAQAATAAVIASTGGKAGVSAEQIRSMAEAQESLTTADDRAIQQGENLLLTFTNIGKTVFPDATKALVNMAIAMNKGDAATADFDGTAIQLGKALNDPVKGFTALSRVGVSFNEAQTKILKGSASLNKEELKHYQSLRRNNKSEAERYKQALLTNKRIEAQKVILAELNTEFGKAGTAAGEGFTGDVNRARDAIEDAQVAIAQGLMPAVAEVARELTKTLSDPQVQSGLKELGKGIGDAIKGLVAFAKTVPWGSIASSLQAAAGFAKDLLNAFLGLPDWVKTAVITGWGLNKLTGGALNDLIGSLASGLVKGVLGINAGVVNVRGAAVTGGGIPTGGGAAGAAKGGLGLASKLFLIGETIGLIASVEAVREEIAAGATEQAQSIHQQTTDFIASQPDQQALLTSLAGVDKGIADLRSNPLNVLVQGSALDELQGMRADIIKALGTTTPGKIADDLAPIAQTSDIKDMKGKLADDIDAVKTATTRASGKVADDVVRSGNLLYAGQYGAAAGIIGAIQSNRPIIDVNVDISGTTLQQTVSVTDRGGSPDSDRYRGGKPPGGM